MIKVGIIGADKADAGELLRLLINHPEVDIVSLYAPSLSGRMVASWHHGFIGERSLYFSDSINLNDLDAVFIVDDSDFGRSVIESCFGIENLKVIDLSPDRFKNWAKSEMEYGLSEINRKPLVRGAHMAIVPSSVASVALISLYPLAANLLLADKIFIDVSAPEIITKDIDLKVLSWEITRQLKNKQNSFDGEININILPDTDGRAVRVTISMACPLAIDEIRRIYDSIYDDHNFAFTSLSKVGAQEVEGTQKCIISFSKPGAGLIEIDSVADSHMRGGAGDAVHALNLLFALHEKVGLSLKPSRFGNSQDVSSRQTSWFA